MLACELRTPLPFLLLKIVDWLVGVRVSEEEEIQGLDLTQRGEGGSNADLDLIPAVASAKTVAAPSRALWWWSPVSSRETWQTR